MPNKGAKVRKNRRKVEPSRVSVKGHPDNENESVIVKESDAQEDVVATDKYVKVVSQLPINNRKENIKVIAHDDNSRYNFFPGLWWNAMHPYLMHSV
jgi:hypothetical protein